jgi:single-strand DNA-binding protein
MSVNKVILIGNLGKDPEVRFTAGGRAVARFSVATSDAWTDAEGQRQERTEWHNIVVWGKQGENCGQYLSKGRPVAVEGRLNWREWEAQDGGKRQSVDIIADAVQFLGSRDAPQSNGVVESDVPADTSDFQEAGVGSGGKDDDIPF